MSVPDHGGRHRSLFADAIVLTKREVFDALEACANAERVLLRCGQPVAAAAVAAFFELLEDRVILDPAPAACADGAAEVGSSDFL